ncbi:MAG: GGDEF domain-containing protein [Phenylobacterium sp.]
MDLLASLRNERRMPRLYRLHFRSPELESEFHDWQRERHAIVRSLLFAGLALGYALTPLFNAELFGAPADVLPTLQTLQWLLVLPVLVCGALAGFLPVVAAQRALHLAAVVTVWAGVLVARWLALRHGFNLPSQMFGMVVIAVAFFGGFGWQNILAGVFSFGGAAVFVEYHWATADSSPGLQTYCILFMGLVAVGGTYTQELLSRMAWLNKRYAEALARTDGLTGLANHYEFHRSFERALALAARERRTVAVTLLDLDHFKSINDRYGHLFGDRVLREIGAMLCTQVARRPLDLRARYGGEEMAVVWYDVKVDALPGLIEGLLDSIRSLPFADPGGGSRVRVTASAGLVWLVPGEDTRPEDVLHNADILLYCAKSEGRDRARMAPFENGLQSVTTMPSAANGEHGRHSRFESPPLD